jgi:mRNA interferase MazF
MSAYKHGDIVIVEFPYSDATGAKLRPVLIISNDTANSQDYDLVCVKITTNQRSDRYAIPLPPTATLLPLPKNSEIRCNKIQTLESGMIKRKVTSLTPLVLERVIAAINTVIEVQP